MKNNHTSKLQKILTDFELFILPEYDNFLEEERKDHKEYNSGISYHDNETDFYSWIDMLSWEDLQKHIERYKDHAQLQEAMRDLNKENYENNKSRN